MRHSVSHDPVNATPHEPGGIPYAIVFGATLAILGLGLVVVGVGMRSDSSLSLLGGVVFGGGVLRLTTALSRDARQRRAYLANADDPRWHGGSGMMQLAGRRCAACRLKIVIGTDAVACDACGEAIHLDCQADHFAIGHDLLPATTMPR